MRDILNQLSVSDLKNGFNENWMGQYFTAVKYSLIELNFLRQG
jgi:hypothetical protein